MCAEKQESAEEELIIMDISSPIGSFFAWTSFCGVLKVLCADIRRNPISWRRVFRNAAPSSGTSSSGYAPPDHGSVLQQRIDTFSPDRFTRPALSGIYDRWAQMEKISELIRVCNCVSKCTFFLILIECNFFLGAILNSQFTEFRFQSRIIKSAAHHGAHLTL